MGWLRDPSRSLTSPLRLLNNLAVVLALSTWRRTHGRRSAGIDLVAGGTADQAGSRVATRFRFAICHAYAVGPVATGLPRFDRRSGFRRAFGAALNFGGGVTCRHGLFSVKDAAYEVVQPCAIGSYATRSWAQSYRCFGRVRGMMQA